MKTNHEANARFWTWWNGGWVKLTLRPGQRLVLHAFRRTDEGYSEQHEEYKHEGSAVLRRICGAQPETAAWPAAYTIG
jgi:hypothetical protein